MPDDREETLDSIRSVLAYAADTMDRLSGEPDWFYRYVHYDTKTGEFREEMCGVPDMGAFKRYVETARLLAGLYGQVYGAQREEDGTGVIVLGAVTDGEEGDEADESAQSEFEE